MSRDVVVVPQEMSLQAAAHLLAMAQISGAPVVDVQGRCIGVLSAADFVRCVEKGPGLEGPEFDRLAFCADWQLADLKVPPTAMVREYMTTDVVTVPPMTPLRDLCRKMLDAHIHRLIVTDPRRRPIGVVSTTNILAALAHSDSCR
jgi:predicted transcriptional regulator